MQKLLFVYCRKCQTIAYLPTGDLCDAHQERRNYLDLRKTNPELYIKIRKEKLRQKERLYHRHKLNTDPYTE